MGVEIDPSLDYRHWRKDFASVFRAIHSSFVNYSARPEVLTGLREAGFASFDAINYLSEGGLFRYDAALFSGGGAELDIQKSKAINPSIWNRRADTVLMSDSGGFQVATGILAPKQYYELREKITSWQEAISDIAIAMDVPTGSIGNRKAKELLLLAIEALDDGLVGYDVRPKFPPVMSGVPCGFDARNGRLWQAGLGHAPALLASRP